MPWDIYGQPLRRGYCEVHPDVNAEYPCPLCFAESRRYEQDQQYFKNEWRRTDDALPRDGMTVLGYYRYRDRETHRLVYCKRCREHVEWFNTSEALCPPPDYWLPLSAPDVDTTPRRAGYVYAGDGRTEPFEYKDEPRDNTDEQVDDALSSGRE